MNYISFANQNIPIVQVLPMGHEIWNVHAPEGCLLFCRLLTNRESWRRAIDPKSLVAFFFPEAQFVEQNLPICHKYGMYSFSDINNKAENVRNQKDRATIIEIKNILKKYV